MQEEGEMDLVDYSIEKDQEQDYLPDYNAVGTQIQLQDKQLEPDQSLSGGNINRNLQLGNIGTRTFIDSQDLMAFIEQLENIPLEHGGYLLNRFSYKWRRLIDFTFITSGSIEGYVREILATQKKTYKKEESRQGRSWRDRLRVPS